ncbi:hypothetical protein [Raineyella sp.]|uniref:Uncharacterized protein n=1 Tax=bioreactor metagenome TaxID=1076179 RepID=A0A644YAH8_9ZZZZ|nr:hypothetical protein [Raineyella sp.]MEA5155594.1 hypothetical protein [Raineyella sp.]
MLKHPHLDETALLAATGADSFTPRWDIEDVDDCWRRATRTQA